MATKTVVEYENEMEKMKKQIEALEKSKIELVKNTTREIDRLRGYIKQMTPNRTKNGFVIKNMNPNTNHTQPKPINPSIVSPITSDDPHPDVTTPDKYVTDNLPKSSGTTSPRPNDTDPGENDDNGMDAAIEMHHSIIEEMQKMLDEVMGLTLFGVVECKCTEPKQLELIATMDIDKPHMKCDNCHHKYSLIFKCDACTMSICSKCQKYIAEMQCLRSVMHHFKYPKDFEKEIETTHTQETYDHEYTDSLYSGFSPNYQSQYQGHNHNALGAKLMKLEEKLHFKAMDKLEDILKEDLISFTHVTSEMCFDILDYLDEVDWCCILPSKSSLQLLEIYWQIYTYHISYEHQWKQWKKLRLLFSNEWDDTDCEHITIKDRIKKNDNVTKQYLNDYYIQYKNGNGNQLIKPKLLYDVNEEAEHRKENVLNGFYYNFDEERNRNFGTRVIRLLRIIIDKEEYNNARITCERLKHKTYGEHNDILANGIFYIWHCHGLKRSFALEEQIFSSFAAAMIEEEDDDMMNIHINNDNTNNEYETGADAFGFTERNGPLTPMCESAPQFTYTNGDNSKTQHMTTYHLNGDESSSHSLQNSDDGSLPLIRFNSDENDYP